jgi:hypothetical protein
MFHFPAFPPLRLCVQRSVTGNYASRVAPFGDPRIEACLAAPRGLSQPATSFVGSWCQGIHRVPFVLWLLDAHARYGVLNVWRISARHPDRSEKIAGDLRSPAASRGARGPSGCLSGSVRGFAGICPRPRDGVPLGPTGNATCRGYACQPERIARDLAKRAHASGKPLRRAGFGAAASKESKNCAPV